MARWWYLVPVVLGSVFPNVAFAQAKAKDATLNRILADWKQRQHLFKSVRYVITGTTEYKDYTEAMRGKTVWPRRTWLLLDFEKQRFRLETQTQAISEGPAGTWKVLPRISTSAYDGKTGQAYTHRDANAIADGADLVISNGMINGTGFDSHLWPLLFAHGLVPTVHTDVRLGRLPPVYDPEDFAVLGRQNFHARECTLVETEPLAGIEPSHDEFWIDLNQGSTIHRYVAITGSNPFTRLDIEWKRTAFGWWPEKWTLAWSMNGKVRRIHRLQIDSFVPNPAVSDDDFKLPAKPGMQVIVAENPTPGTGLNPYLPASRTYRVTSTGSWEEIAARGFTTTSGNVLPPEHKYGWPWWVAAAVATVVVCYFFFRRYKLGGI